LQLEPFQGQRSDRQVRLPGSERAFIDIQKLRDYCLNPAHPRGRHKARVFLASLGLGQADAGVLCDYLASAARTQEAQALESDEFGDRCVVDFECLHAERRASIRSGWIVLRSEDFPRLTTCFVQ
jgi:hypothetical protein